MVASEALSIISRPMSNEATGLISERVANYLLIYNLLNAYVIVST